jgi:K+-transporting ATPase A subunit
MSEFQQKRATITDVYMGLKYMINLIQRAIWLNQSGQVRCSIDGTNNTVISSGTVTTVNQFSGIANYESSIIEPLKMTWALNIRGRVT